MSHLRENIGNRICSALVTGSQDSQTPQYPHLQLCTHTYIYIYIYMYMYVYIYVYIYVCICVYMYSQTPQCLHLQLCTHIYLCIYIYICIMYIYLYIYTYVHVYICIVKQRNVCTHKSVVAVRCRVLQCVAVCCSAWQRVVLDSRTLQYAHLQMCFLQCVTVHCSV